MTELFFSEPSVNIVRRFLMVICCFNTQQGQSGVMSIFNSYSILDLTLCKSCWALCIYIWSRVYPI